MDDAPHTLMMPWQVARGSPTRLVSLMDMIWSPTLSLPERAAGPLFSIPARMTVGRMEPQPDSTITTPRLSPFCFSTSTYDTRDRSQRTRTSPSLIICSQFKIKKQTSLQLSEFEKWTRSSWYISWELMMSLYCFWLSSVGLMPLARRNSL